jgi:hypothetical protein
MNSTLDPWLHINSHAHAMLVEQVMAIHGRGSRDPKRYRQLLQSQDLPTLRRALTHSDFPVLPETTDDTTHATRASGASTPVRETLILQSTLP